MVLNLKKLQSIARRRLALSGEVEFVKVSSSNRGGVLATSTNLSDMKHAISYGDASSLDPADIYHEMCRAKLDEYGFKSIENVALVALKDCAKDDPKYIIDANSAVVIVSEVYASWLLFTYFQEAEERRQEIVLRFASSDALTSVHTRMGFWGIAGIAYYKISSEWAGKEFPSKQVDDAIKRASDGKAIFDELSKIEGILRGLPKIEKMNEKFSDSSQLQILDIITRLFAAKTGLEC
ncbi:MAG: hypothetical protein ACREBS_05205 [Nitrososphaerales archaeon]